MFLTLAQEKGYAVHANAGIYCFELSDKQEWQCF